MSFFRNLFSKKRKGRGRGATDSPAIPPEFAEDLNHAMDAWQHYQDTGEQTALDAAANAWRRILDTSTFAAAEIHYQLAGLNMAGLVFLQRFERTEQMEDLTEAIQLFERAVAETPSGSPDLPAHLNNLSNALQGCFDRTWRGQDLAEAIQISQRVVAEMPAGSPNLYAHLNNLGTELRKRFARTGQTEDLEEAIRVHRRAVAEIPARSPNLSFCLNNLGAALQERFARTGRLQDLDEAIRAFEHAVSETPPGSPDLPARLHNQSNGLRERYERTGREEDLDEAIQISQRVVAEMPAGSPDLHAHLNNLGNGLHARFRRTGRKEDLYEAIQLYQQAVAEAPMGLPYAHMYLTNLGNGLSERFLQMGQLEDLDEAIRVLERAVAETPAGSPELPACLNNLGGELRERFGRTGREEDLDEAIRVSQRAVTETPSSSPDLPMYLNNLGNGLGARFGRTGREEDLGEAIRVFRRAVAKTQVGSPQLSTYLNNLSLGLGNRFRSTGRGEDLEEAIQLSQQAVANTPMGSPSLPARINNLGKWLHTRFVRIGRLEDLENAIQCYRRACELGALSVPQLVLDAASNWGCWAVQRKQWVETAEAYGHGLATGRQLLSRQLLRMQKESVLRDLQEMSGPAAYALAKIDRLQEAVTTVEGGRARLLAEALQRNRRDLEQLPALGHEDLYERYREIVETQERLTQRVDARPDQFDHSSGQARLDAIVAANAAFDQVVAEIQKLPGYADFLAEPTFAQIRTAAQEAPLVFLLATSAGGLALIVHTGAVQPIWLDELTDATVHEWLRGPADDPELGGWLGTYQSWLVEKTEQAQQAWFTVVNDVTRQLWSHILEPVAAALRRVLPVDPSSVPEVTLIPAGLLALLPLHAAWTEDPSTPTGRRYFLDEFTVRYAPSALALQHARDVTGRVVAERLLAVEDPLAANAMRLPNAHVGVSAITDLFDDSVILAGLQATRQAVRKALPLAQVMHFFCHGHNDWQSPLDSGLLMADDETGKDVLLTVRDLLETKKAGGRLATLAACETGIVGMNLPDEAVMLPGALLQVGFGGVAASLWSVAEISTVMLMEHFYHLWREKRLPPAQALRAAQRWVRDTTNGEKAEYFRRYSPTLSNKLLPEAAAIEFFNQSMSRDLDSRDFEHPFWWAAFYLTGV